MLFLVITIKVNLLHLLSFAAEGENKFELLKALLGQVVLLQHKEKYHAGPTAKRRDDTTYGSEFCH